VQRLRQAAERAKHELSSGSRAHVAVEALQGGHDLAVSVGRNEFESPSLDLFSRCLEPVEKVMAVAAGWRSRAWGAV
jgi:L1 cell adhesion molecule like protein